MFSHKESLPPPPSANVTWPEYASCPPGEHPTLGRKPVFKESSKAFKATVAMSEEFPLSVEMLLNVLEVIGDFDGTPWHDVHEPVTNSYDFRRSSRLSSSTSKSCGTLSR